MSIGQLRAKLEAEGVAPERIEEVIARRRARRSQRRPPSDEVYVWEDGELVAVQRARLEAETYERLSPDDTKSRPTAADPLLRGPARATGETAKAVRRGRTVPKWRHDEAS